MRQKIAACEVDDALLSLLVRVSLRILSVLPSLTQRPRAGGAAVRMPKAGLLCRHAGCCADRQSRGGSHVVRRLQRSADTSASWRSQAAIAPLRSAEPDPDRCVRQCRGVLEPQQTSPGVRLPPPLTELAYSFPAFTAELQSQASQLQVAVASIVNPTAAGKAARELSRQQLLDSHPLEAALSAAAHLASKVAQQLGLPDVPVSSEAPAGPRSETAMPSTAHKSQPDALDGELLLAGPAAESAC